MGYWMELFKVVLLPGCHCIAYCQSECRVTSQLLSLHISINFLHHHFQVDKWKSHVCKRPSGMTHSCTFEYIFSLNFSWSSQNAGSVGQGWTSVWVYGWPVWSFENYEAQGCWREKTLFMPVGKWGWSLLGRCIQCVLSPKKRIYQQH